MNSHKGCAGAMRWSPLALAVALACVPGASWAQDDATELERVEVTGSRIKRAEAEGQAPVLTLEREDIQATGLLSVGDIIQQITASGSALNTKFNSSGNFGFPPDGGGVGAGSTTIDLRNLGCKRVLVLVDGLRWVSESSASGVSSCTDLNTIPVSIVERIEVLQDGASAIYGSDAIAGVVNIITRRSFDGLEFGAYYGENEEGDGETTNFDVSVGGSGDRFDFFVGASYYKQREIASKDREQSSFPVPGTGLTFGSSATPQGRYVFTDPRTGNTSSITLNPGTITPVYDPLNPTGGTSTYNPFDTSDRFNFAQFNLLLTPSERRGLYNQTHFEITDNTTWYFKGLYNERESTNQAAPEPIFLGPEAGTGNAYADNIFISRTNPYNPFGIDFISTGPDANLIFFGRRPIEGGARVFNQEVDTWYIATGFEGNFDLGARKLYWDLNYANSQNKAEQTNYGSYNIRRIAQALGPVDACNADPNCVPLNYFGGQGAGGGTITPEMLAYIQPIIRDSSEQELELYSANLTGDLFELPAGALAFAAGYEYREYSGSYQPDALTVAGEYNGVPSLPTSGEYDVSEFYGELNAPIYESESGASKLDLSLAGRYSDYDFGESSKDETTGKFGLRWQLNEQFLARGTYSEGFRAPTIGELFGSASRFDATLSDPCSIGLDGSPAPGNPANCTALGVPPGYQQANSQISVTTGGNSDLEPETADTYTAGLVWSPAFAVDTNWSERLDFEFTYYNVEVEGAIQAIDAQTQLNLCVATLDEAYCNGITRATTGGINGFNNRLVNIGQIETDGYDINLYWSAPAGDWGQFNVTWLNTIVADYEAIGVNGVVQPQSEGTEVNDSGIPEWTSNFRVGWSMGDWGANWTVRYLSDLTEQCGDAVDFDVCSNPNDGTNELESTAYNDVQVSWSSPFGAEGLRLAAGVNNLFDEDPPICLSCSLNGYDASNYDVPGRFWYLQASYKF